MIPYQRGVCELLYAFALLYFRPTPISTFFCCTTLSQSTNVTDEQTVGLTDVMLVAVAQQAKKTLKRFFNLKQCGKYTLTNTAQRYLQKEHYYIGVDSTGGATELTEMLFTGQTPRNHVLDWVHMRINWRIRLNIYSRRRCDLLLPLRPATRCHWNALTTTIMSRIRRGSLHLLRIAYF